MSSLRVALVARKFWPIIDGTQRFVSDLATGLQRAGHRPTILTAQWEKHWPPEFIHRDVPVVRFPNWKQSGWGTLRYMSALSRWLRSHLNDFDVVYVAGLRYDAYAVVGALRKKNVPVILSAVESGTEGDCMWHNRVRFGRRIQRRCQLADTVVALSDSALDELQLAGFSSDKTTRLDRGVRFRTSRDAARQSSARKSLSKTHDILKTDDNTPLAVYIGPFHESMGLLPLIKSWCKIVAHHPTAKLWMMGDGSFGLHLWERVGDLNLMHNVIFPGTFDDVTDVLHAADLFVQPGAQNHHSTAMLEAVANGTPVLTARSPDNFEIVGHHGHYLDRITSSTLLDGVANVFANRERSSQLGASARDESSDRFSLAQMVDQHVQLFDRLVAEKSVR